LPTDHLGSTSGQTDVYGNSVTGRDERFYAGVYPESIEGGGLRAGDPTQLTTDRTFTGQKADGAGLLYMNARYYDPALGVFLSPDTVVPDAGTVIDYNRFMYARGNPLRYVDPSGHCIDGVSTIVCV
jgi:RHS repeat-associated protein